MDATTVAVDLAKDVFEVALANRVGRILDRKRLTRRQFDRFVEELPAGTELVMEGCGTAELSPRTFCTFPREFPSLRWQAAVIGQRP